MTWQPILDGANADRARAAILEIADGLATADAPAEDLAVFWSYAAPLIGDEAEPSLVAALDGLGATSNERGLGLIGGLAGLGWTIAHCTEGNEDILEAIDEALLTALASWRGHYDLISGLVGFGVYFLERGDAPRASRGLAAVVDEIERLAQRTPDGIRWHTRIEHLPEHARPHHPDGWHNVGLAHGTPGVVAMLARLPSTARIDELVGGAAAWVDSCRSSDPAASRFPATAGGGPTRMGWCYGDPGVALALWSANHRRGDLDAIALAAIDRTIQGAGVRDAGLCHGAVGLAHIANRWFHATGAPEFRELAQRWYVTTLDMARPGEGIGGYCKWGGSTPEESGWQAASALLDGAIGIGLALIAAISPVEPLWDRKLLLDLRA